MKSFFKIAAGLVLLSFTQQASAAVIRLTGSTAFRGATHDAIIAMMGGAASTKMAHSGTAATKSGIDGASFATFQGTISSISGTSTVYCSWSGSATGIAAVAGNTNVAFIPASALPTGTGYANAALSQAATETTFPAKFAFSDVYKESTASSTAALTDNRLAVIPFTWIRNRLSSSSLTNMTAQAARALYGNSSQPVSLFTGNAADTDQVLPVGRDNGSGTRITMLAETKYGINLPVQQWKITTTGSIGSGTVTQAQVWTIGDGVGSTSIGNGGYSSGGNIRDLMSMSSLSVTTKDATGATLDTGIPVHLVSCIGVGDAATAVGNGAVRMAYEGVTYDGSNAGLIYNGAYTMWGYLHFYHASGLDADETQFKSNLTTQLDNTVILGTSGLRISQMAVSRQTDGAVVGP